MRYNKNHKKEVLIMSQNYTPEFKKKIVRLHVGQRIEGDTNSKLFFRHLSH